MNNALQRIGGVAASLVVTAGLVSGISVVVSTQAEARNTTVTATTNVNVRSGPGTSYRVLGSLGTGQSLPVRGEEQRGWTQVSFSGNQAWVSSQFVVGDGDGDDRAAGATTGRRYGTAALNVRTSPALSASVVTVAPRGQAFDVTGQTRNGYAEVSYQGRARWVSARYLSSGGSGTSGSAPASQVRYATAPLNVRTDASLRARVVDVAARGFEFRASGRTRSGFAEVTFQGQQRWVSTQYLSERRPGGGGSGGPSGTTLPEVTGHRYATTLLAIRPSARGSSSLRNVTRGTRLAITGVVQNGRMQVVVDGAVRWVTAQYLATSQPGTGAGGGSGGSGSSVTGAAGLTSNSRYVLARLQARFPQVRRYHGVRPDPIPDHPSGRAVDALIPDYSSASGRALGREIADWLRANAAELNVEYVIYDQQIWNVRRSGEGWRYMADRGSDTANHKDHVHVTTVR